MERYGVYFTVEQHALVVMLLIVAWGLIAVCALCSSVPGHSAASRREHSVTRHTAGIRQCVFYASNHTACSILSCVKYMNQNAAHHRAYVLQWSTILEYNTGHCSGVQYWPWHTLTSDVAVLLNSHVISSMPTSRSLSPKTFCCRRCSLTTRHCRLSTRCWVLGGA